MALPTFFSQALERGVSELVLDKAESTHATKSRRLRVGDRLQLINGRGLIALGIIQIVEASGIRVVIQRETQHEKPASLMIVTAIPKRERQKTMLDMLAQLGVSDIVPLHCDHSVTRFKTNMLEKWQRITVEACKQSQNPWLPNIHVPAVIDDIIALPDSTVFYADMAGQVVRDLYPINNNSVLVIGPEGGFSEQEVALFSENNVLPLRLADTILRTELAAVSAAVQVKTFL